MNFRFTICLFVILLGGMLARPVAQRRPATERIKVSYCELKKNPVAYNHKLIEVTGFVSKGFENFTLFDPACPSYPEVWLEYGGTAKSGTIYCCGETPARSRPKSLVVENIPIEMVVDERFKQFDKLVQRQPDSVVRATLLGRYFDGEEATFEDRTWRGGYGHMGCCTLLAIEQVLSVELQNSPELDYGAWAQQPNIEKVGCGYTRLTNLTPYEVSLKTQAQADRGEHDWMFTDPKRVAFEVLAGLIKVDPSSIELQQTGKWQGRFVYEWRPGGKKVTYMVVVSRPYWLSYFAKDPKRVSWVVLAAYEAGCGRGN